ncbi:hypothetical protein ACIHCQ_34345 [Streptomyces sp. NPDC052236]|uniref:hypothetical protein n=1 Tax=Streptomyces sp. NPDC052236 TaxID=3365686 RepID=UPI0037CD8698
MALSVVYATDTGHVVGALALTGASARPGGASAVPEVASLVGLALPLRVSLGAGRTATVPLNARELAVAAADDEPGALADPLAYGVEMTAEPTPKPKPTLLRLATWKDGLKLAADGLTITVPVATNRLLKVVALISDEQDTHVLAGEIVAGATEVTLPVTLAAASEHGVLVLVGGWAGRLEKAKVL